MSTHTTSTLEEMGFRVAREIAGEEAVEQVEVVPGVDFEYRPAYHFTFLIDQDRTHQRAGLVRTRLMLKLRDELIALNDAHFPLIKILDRVDWDKRAL